MLYSHKNQENSTGIETVAAPMQVIECPRLPLHLLTIAYYLQDVLKPLFMKNLYRTSMKHFKYEISTIN
jgi:hypothetical protein